MLIGFKRFQYVNAEAPPRKYTMNVMGGKFDTFNVLILYHEDNILHLDLTNVSAVIQDQYHKQDSGDDLVAVFIDSSCKDVRLMISKETVPSLLKISNRVKGMIADQRRKLRTRLVALRPLDTSNRYDDKGDRKPSVLTITEGRIRMAGDSFTLAVFQNNFTDADWIQVKIAQFNLSFVTTRDNIQEITVQVVYLSIYLISLNDQ